MILPERHTAQASTFASTVEHFAGRQRAFMQAYYNGATSSGGPYKIGAAYTLDGVEWVRDARNPILEAGGGWEGTNVKEPKVVVVDDVMWLFYVGRNASSQWQIGVAKSVDYGATWTKSANNPIISIGSSTTWDDTNVRFHVVLYDADAVSAKRWKMWYAGEGTANEGDIGYAYAADPEGPWTKAAGNPVLERGASGWDAYSVYPGCVIKVGSTYYLYYGGKDSSGGLWQVGLATFTDPEGTYTKSADNPVLARKSTADQALTADTLSGSAVVTVGDTSVFSVNEYVLIRDGDTEPQLSRIKTIDSSTQLTLRDTVDADYTTAQSARIRSIYYGSVFPSSIWREGDKWVLGITPFQTFTELRELGGFATSTSLAGSFTVDVNRGVYLEFDSTNSTWDTISAENFAVIPGRFSPLLHLAEGIEFTKSGDTHLVRIPGIVKPEKGIHLPGGTGKGFNIQSTSARTDISVNRTAANTGTGLGITSLNGSDAAIDRVTIPSGVSNGDIALPADDIVAQGGYRQTFDDFYRDDVAASLTATQLTRLASAHLPTAWIAPRAGSVTGLAISLSEARTAGTLTVQVYKNNAAVSGLSTVIDGTNTSWIVGNPDKDTYTFAAGDYLDLRVTTSADWAPTTSDLRAVLEVET